MLVLSTMPNYETLSLRPVDKKVDRTAVREIFRREFFGEDRTSFPDEELWQVYDRMETTGVFGAYMVSLHNHPLFLLEVHPAIQLDLPPNYLREPGTIGIFCFYNCRQDIINLPALRACVAALFNTPTVNRILTTVGMADPDNPRVSLLKRAGFRQLPLHREDPAVFCCTRESLEKTRTGILYTAAASLSKQLAG